MLDAKDKQQLSARLRGKIKKANSNVSTKVDAENGSFKVTISDDSVTHFYKGDTVSTIRVAQLDNDLINYINDDPHEAAQEILDEFSSTFDVQNFESKKANNSKTVKQAAHDTLDKETWNMVTQKQFDDQKPDLHPRKDDYYTNITQKQIPEHGQRPGTYDTITEGQFRDEQQTFYGADRTAGNWKQEDRSTITEAQFEKGVDEYTEVGESDRSEIGSKYDGGIQQQQKQIGEKQLAELLKHHEWTEPLTTTEGKEQLGKQDGELARITSQVAEKIIKEALNALGNTVLSVGVTPQHISKILQRLVSHDSKYPALANTIQLYKGASISTIQKKIAKARHFGKTANTSKDWSDLLTADVLVRQLSNMSYHPDYIVQSIISLAKQENIADRINKAADVILQDDSTKEESTLSVFDQVLDEKTADVVEGSPEEDGLYAYVGKIDEVDADSNNQKDFSEKAAALAHDKILEKTANKNLSLIPQIIDVDQNKGVFEIRFKDAARQDVDLVARARRRRKQAAKQAAKQATKQATKQAAKQVEKQAQMGGAGGMPPAAGPEMGNPMAPPGGGDMAGAPPGEALSQEPPADPMVEDEKESADPKPPGAICPICGGEDVDVDHGEFRCNNCGGEGEISVKLDINKWPGTIQETDNKEQEGGFGLDEGALGAEEDGMAASGPEAGGVGEGTTLPNVPVGASVRVTPFMIEKLSEQKIQLGTICPNCGSNNTQIIKSAKFKGQNGLCYECYQNFNFQVKVIPGRQHNVYAQFMWTPKIADSNDCQICGRTTGLKKAFAQSLHNYGMNLKQFNNLNSIREQADIILKMNASGTLNITEALALPLPLQKLSSKSTMERK